MADVEQVRVAIQQRREVAEAATKRWPGPQDARLGYVPTVIIEHIGACDPATVIRWLDADLAILDAHPPAAPHFADYCATCSAPGNAAMWPCRTVRAVAGKYLENG